VLPRLRENVAANAGAAAAHTACEARTRVHAHARTHTRTRCFPPRADDRAPLRLAQVVELEWGDAAALAALPRAHLLLAADVAYGMDADSARARAQTRIMMRTHLRGQWIIHTLMLMRALSRLAGSRVLPLCCRRPARRGLGGGAGGRAGRAGCAARRHSPGAAGAFARARARPFAPLRAHFSLSVSHFSPSHTRARLLTRAACTQLRPLREEGLFCAALAPRFSVTQIATPATTTTATKADGANEADAAADGAGGVDADGLGLGIFRLRALPPAAPLEAAAADAHTARQTDDTC
jgi:hypothetical protein